MVNSVHFTSPLTTNIKVNETNYKFLYKYYIAPVKLNTFDDINCPMCRKCFPILQKNAYLLDATDRTHHGLEQIIDLLPIEEITSKQHSRLQDFISTE